MFEYEIKVSNKARRNTSIRIVEGKVIVTTPRGTPRGWVQKLVESKEAWIEHHLAKDSGGRKYQFVAGERFLYLGRDYPLEVTRGSRKRMSLRMTGEGFWLSLPKDADIAHHRTEARKVFENFYRKRAKIYLWQRTRYFAQVLGVGFGEVRIKDTKTRWGSCSSAGNINYSWRLMMTPPEVADSVVAHEVSHLIHQHHKKTFWELLYRLYPSYKADHRWLINNKHLLSL